MFAIQSEEILYATCILMFTLVTLISKLTLHFIKSDTQGTTHLDNLLCRR